LTFLKSLTPDDVIYFDRKKKVYAAKIIWVSSIDEKKAWRRSKLRTLLTKTGREKFKLV